MTQKKLVLFIDDELIEFANDVNIIISQFLEMKLAEQLNLHNFLEKGIFSMWVKKP